MWNCWTMDCGGGRPWTCDWKILPKCFRPQIEILADLQTAGSRPVWKWLQQHFSLLKFWHFSHWIFGLILMLSKTLSENGCNNISDIFHIGTLCIAVNALAWFWCSQKLCKSLRSKLIGFCKMGTIHLPIFSDHPAVTYDQRSAPLLPLDKICTTRWQEKSTLSRKIGRKFVCCQLFANRLHAFFRTFIFKSQVINARDCSTCYPSDEALPIIIDPLGTWRLRGNGRTCCCSL